MKLTTLVFSIAFLGSSAWAESFHNQPQVLRGALMLQTEVEHFDESLHEVKAPAPLVQKVHHFEETVTDFVMDLQKNCTYQHALTEFAHIREDFQSIREGLYAVPGLLNNQKVWNEWNGMRRAYRYLDHALYTNFHGSSQQTAREMDKLAGELEAHQDK